MNLSMRTQLVACIAVALSIAAVPALAQDHSMQGMDMSMPGMVMAAKKKVVPKAATVPAKKAVGSSKPAVRKAASDPAPHAHASTSGTSGMSGMDMANMPGMAAHATAAKPKRAAQKASSKPASGMGGMAEMSGMPGMSHGSAMPPHVAKKAGSARHKTVTNAMKSTPGMDMSGMDHAGMQGMPGMEPKPGADTHAVDPSMQGVDPSGMQGMDPSMPGMDHSNMQGMDPSMSGMSGPSDLAPDASPRTPIPALTDADRAAAFPPGLAGHAAHDRRVHSFWLADRLEVADGGGNGAWEGMAWIGGDIHRLWLRSEGEVDKRRVEDGRLEVLYGRSISPWWDVVGGVREDFGRGTSRTSAAFGVQGLAPYKFEAAATAYAGSSGRTSAILEGDYDTLFTNKLIMQWRSEARLYGRSDPQRGVGSGLSTVEVGARLRYEINKQFAPYVGVEVSHAFGGTADLRRSEGRDTTDTRIVAGIRFWF